MKLYNVKIELVIVVHAENEDAAEKEAFQYSSRPVEEQLEAYRRDLCHFADIEEIKSTKQLDQLWEESCLPYGRNASKGLTIGEILEKQNK